MDFDRDLLVPPILLALLTIVLLAGRLSGGRFTLPGYFRYVQAFLLVCVVADFLSFAPAVWLMAIISFRALREYFTLVDLRIEDRWGILGAYLSIPFMIYLIQIDWYGFFIVSIPVYAFIVIPFLVTLGDSEGRGCLLSVGAIDFGLFFFVYCLGHIAYLAFFSSWLLLLLLIVVTACNMSNRLTLRWGMIGGWLVSCVVSLAITWLLRPWTLIPAGPSLFVGILIPTLVRMSDYTIGVLEKDLGISPADLEPGRGRVLDSLKSYLFAAPIVFHFLRWIMKFGESILPGRGM